MAALLLFHLSGSALAFPADAIAELVLEPRLLRPPAAPSVVAGLLNRRGEPVPVVRLSRLLELPDPPPGLFRVLVVLSRPLRWAVLAERADAVLDLHTQPPPEAGMSFNDCVTALAGIAGGMVAVLSPERLLRRNEILALEDFSQWAGERMEDFSLAHS